MADLLGGSALAFQHFDGCPKGSPGTVVLKNGAKQLSNSGFSIVCWVRPQFTGEEMGIFGGGNWNTGKGGGAERNGYLHCTLHPRTPCFNFGYNDLEATQELEFKKWSSIACIFDSSKGKRILINGVLSGSDSKTEALWCNSGDLLIGKTPHCPGFRGDISGLQCFKDALSDDVVRMLLASCDPRKIHGDEEVTAPGAAIVEYTPFERAFWPGTNLSAAEQNQMVAVRTAIEITVLDDEDGLCNTYPPLLSFEDLVGVLPTYTFTALQQMGLTDPLPVQCQALPIILGGHDLIGIAKTGSGKTLAFLLPAIVHIEAQQPLEGGQPTPIVLTLAPTRELAVQITGEAQKLLSFSQGGSTSHPNGIWAASIIGGLQKREQMREMQGAHILVATPGRLMDHVQNDEISLRRVTYFVLDEADRMLDCGFEGQVKTIAASVRTDRHMCFFSATWPKEVQDLAKGMCFGGQKPVRIAVGQQEEGSGPASNVNITQEVLVFDQWTWEARDEAKQKELYTRVGQWLSDPTNKLLVFVSRKDLCDELVKHLWKQGLKCDAMHGGRSQNCRLAVLDSFRKSETRLLVTTDVMGRGIDIPDITHVVLYDMGEIEDYVHRIGRTARGPTGTGNALTFFEHNDKFPQLADELIQVLEAAGQPVSDEVRKIAQQVREGKRVRETNSGGGWPAGKKQKKNKSSSWNGNGNDWSNSSWGGSGSSSSWSQGEENNVWAALSILLGAGNKW